MPAPSKSRLPLPRSISSTRGITNGRTLLAKSIACSFMALTATKEQLLFGKGGLSQPIVARRGSPGDFANSVRSFLHHPSDCRIDIFTNQSRSPPPRPPPSVQLVYILTGQRGRQRGR